MQVAFVEVIAPFEPHADTPSQSRETPGWSGHCLDPIFSAVGVKDPPSSEAV